MQAVEAKRIIEALATGIDPITGEVLPDDSPVNEPQVIRALFMAANALVTEAAAVEADTRKRASTRVMAGKPWSEEEDVRLLEGFDAGKTVNELAVIHLRKHGGIEARLIKHGRLPASGGSNGGNSP